MLSRDYIKQLPQNPLDALVVIISDFTELEVTSSLGPDGWDTRNLPSFLDYASIAKNLIIVSKFGVSFDWPSREGNKNQQMEEISDLFLGIRVWVAGAIAKDEFAAASERPKYLMVELSDSDLKRIQTLIAEMRKIAVETRELEQDHRRRLLDRLEKMQAELHKAMSNLDVFWGGVVDAGEALGTVGEKIKPFVDRMREIKNILWNNRKRITGLENKEEQTRLPGHDDTNEIEV
jgi:hypothetical protein